MRKWIIATMIICMAAGAPASVTAKSETEVKMKATGYFPGGYKSKKQARIEGGKFDRFGNLLKTLENYKPGEYVSVATDPRVIKSGTEFHIAEIPGVKFFACDVGRAIKGRKIDICVNNEKATHVLPKRVTIILSRGNSKNENSGGRGRVIRLRDRIADVQKVASAFMDLLSKLQRDRSMAGNNPGFHMVGENRISPENDVFIAGMGLSTPFNKGFQHR